MAPNTKNICVISGDNNNENSFDPNPYAYPYFHADGSFPLLYELVVTHFGNMNDDDNNGGVEEGRQDRDRGNTTMTATATASTRTHNSNGGNGRRNSNTFHRTGAFREKVAKRIKSRCLVRPMEAGWADSCGDNALHRLCQLVRFSKKNDQQIYDMNLNLNSISDADLVLLAQRYIIEAESKAATASNNWGETPLHQFVSHCGFVDDFDLKQREDIANIDDNYDYQHKNDNRHHHLLVETLFCPNPNLKKSNLEHLHPRAVTNILKHTTTIIPSVQEQFLEALLQAFPESVCKGNYLKALPLHEACGLSQLQSTKDCSLSSSSSPASSSSSQDVFNFVDFSIESGNELVILEKKRHEMENAHLNIIKRLLEYYPAGVVELDAVGRTPLCRAVRSRYCGVRVVNTLLKEMEVVLERTAERSFKNVSTKSLMRIAILGKLINGGDSDENQKGIQQTQKNPPSPMKELWDILVEPHKVSESIFWLSQQQLNYSPQQASISQVIETALHAFPTSSVSDNHDAAPQKEFRMREKEIAVHLSRQMGHLHKKACHLMMTAYWGSADQHNFTDVESKEECSSELIHAAIFCSAPRCILNLVIRMNPDEMTSIGVDGNTPLTMLLSMPQFWNPKVGWQTGNYKNSLVNDRARDKGILETILWAQPDAAKIANYHGQYPLHLALINGLSWHNGICDIFHVHPIAVSTIDPVTKLFPFMLASITKDRKELPDEEIADNMVDKTLTTTYELLRVDPAVLAQILF